MSNPVDVLIAGAGPAGLATAIRLRQRLREAKRDASVVVIDKAPKLGYHNLSGAVFEAGCLDTLVPGWREEKDPFIEGMVPVKRDEMFFLTETGSRQVPAALVPKPMHHVGDHAISINRLVRWLGGVAKREGAEIHLGFSAKEPVMDGEAVRGLRLADQGRSTHGPESPGLLPGETIEARVTVFCDGSRGVLSRQLGERLRPSRNPQVYSVGVKQLIKLPKDNAFGEGRVIHTLGFPLPSDVFGGGFLYDMGHHEVAIGLILGLDWRYPDLNPHRELERLKEHPFIAELLKDGEVTATGVKTIPEGGFYSLPTLVTEGALLAGDAAGFVNMRKIKGIHYAILSGIAAADTIFDALERDDFSEQSLLPYKKTLGREVLEPLRSARNFRQVFQLGLHVGAPLSTIQHLLPFGLPTKPDHEALRPGVRLHHDDGEGMDKATFVNLSGANHREDEPSHILIQDPALCESCEKEYGAPCVQLCPGEVYRMRDHRIVLSPSNCMHDGSCSVKCPHQNVIWTAPEGGEGPRYRKM